MMILPVAVRNVRVGGCPGWSARPNRQYLEMGASIAIESRWGVCLVLKLLMLFGFAAWIGSASADQFSVRPLPYHFVDCDSKRQSVSFPFLEFKADRITARVNSYLHLLILDRAPPPISRVTSEEGIDESWAGDQLREMRVGVPVITNGGRVLGVAISQESCTSFGTAGEVGYFFDIRDGSLVIGDDLLTKVGRAALGLRLLNDRRLRIVNEIGRLNRELGSRKAGRESIRSRDAVTMYRNCLKDRFDVDSRARSSGEGGEFPGVMSFGDGWVEFGMASCASQVDASLDSLGGLNNKLSAEELRPYLSEYGKYILLGDGNATAPLINPLGQVFRGRIAGGIPVTLYMGRLNPNAHSEPYSDAKYYYDKYRRVIKLSVVKRGDVFELTEIDSAETPKPVLKFTIKGAKLVGHWQGGGKTLSFEAAP